MKYTDPFQSVDQIEDEREYNNALEIWSNEMREALKAKDQARVIELWYGPNSKYNVPIN